MASESQRIMFKFSGFIHNIPIEGRMWYTVPNKTPTSTIKFSDNVFVSTEEFSKSFD